MSEDLKLTANEFAAACTIIQILGAGNSYDARITTWEEYGDDKVMLFYQTAASEDDDEDVWWDGRFEIAIPKKALASKEVAKIYCEWKRAKKEVKRAPAELERYAKTLTCSRRERDALERVIAENGDDPANKCLRGRVGELKFTIERFEEYEVHLKEKVKALKPLLSRGWAEIPPSQTRLFKEGE